MRDTGVGIPAKELTRLFDPFFQVGNGVQRNFQGTGLGLAICEKLINMMDGDIEVESEPGMGSQFIVRIPIYNGKQPSIPLLDGLQDKKIWLAMRVPGPVSGQAVEATWLPGRRYAGKPRQ